MWIPIYGRVAAGIPFEVDSNIEGYVPLPEDMSSNGDFFALRITGNSMEPRIWDGDTVIVRKQSTAANKDIVIVLIDGHEATCKELQRHGDGITLIGMNPVAYEPQFFTAKEIEELPIEILGKVVRVIGNLE